MMIVLCFGRVNEEVMSEAGRKVRMNIISYFILSVRIAHSINLSNSIVFCLNVFNKYRIHILCFLILSVFFCYQILFFLYLFYPTVVVVRRCTCLFINDDKCSPSICVSV